MFDLFRKKSNVPVEDSMSQEQKVLNALRISDLGVREIMVELWINSPTKVISRLRRRHDIINVGKGKFAVYHLVESN